MPDDNSVPQIGMGATELVGSDRYPFTVIAVSPSGKTAKIQADEAIRLDNRGIYTESQDYRYERDLGGRVHTIRRYADGKWYRSYRIPVILGHRDMYRDPHF